MSKQKFSPPRKTLFDSLPTNPQSNLYCNLDDLDNEASVETFFINRMLKDLGYRDSQIKTKKAISEIAIPRGSKKVNYKPDYALTLKSKPRWILEAKAPNESLDQWVPQSSGYCLELNQTFDNEKPVQYFVLTNGVLSRLYKWDSNKPLLELAFSDFTWGNPKFEQWRAILCASSFLTALEQDSPKGEDFEFRRPSPETAKQIFAQCHRVIWKSEGLGRAAAFMEFTKLMFVKFWADRKLREDKAIKKILEETNYTKLPKSAIAFSTHWIESIEKQVENPINDTLFKSLRDTFEVDISQGTKKRIFDVAEQIDLSPDTIKAVVKRLEHSDMFGIDEDLNGRLFETFLSATMRGEELGQYFTPRSIVLLMTRMADLKIGRAHTDKVLDGCCGTGGFLIEALAEMRNKVRANKSLTRDEKDSLINQLSNECLYGIDFGKNPPIARIARINMYLHGDGGSRIYYADFLDKDLEVIKGQDPEVIRNQRELKDDLQGGLLFDVALTNPPFSMTKELSNDSEARILKGYDLAKIEGTARYRPSLRSSAMVLERYCDFLKPGGRLFTVIDDTVLASDEFREVRNFVRKHFIIRAIVSLPADAFQRAGARVKTSILCLEKKIAETDAQPDVFVAFSQNLGVDDLTPRAILSDVAEARNQANAEIEKISGDFQRFLNGANDVRTVTPDRVKDRLDLKYVVPLQGRFVAKWQGQGIDVKRLGDVALPATDEIHPQDYPEQNFVLIKVTYAGECQVVKTQKGKHVKPTTMTHVHTGDLVFSNIRAINGAIGVVPSELDGAVLSGSFTILHCSTYADTVYLWAILRTHEIRADLMSPSVGSGRYTLDWQRASQVQIPWLKEPEREKIADGFIKSWDLSKQIPQLQKSSLEAIAKLDVESEASQRRFKENQPPQ